MIYSINNEISVKHTPLASEVRGWCGVFIFLDKVKKGDE
jgi:hypothetical protein